MKFFDKLFKFKRSGNLKQKSSNEEPKSTHHEEKKSTDINRSLFSREPLKSKTSVDIEVSLIQYILQQYQQRGLNIEVINEEYVKPCLEALLKNEYQNKSFQHNPEAFKEKYFLLFSIAYLVYHSPENDLLETLLKYFFSEGTLNYKARETIRTGGRSELAEFPERQGIVNTGADILRIYHALYQKTDANFSYTSQVPSMLNNARLSPNENDFNILLNIVAIHTTFETPWVLVHVLVYKHFDYKTKTITTYSDKKESVIQLAQEVLKDFEEESNLELTIEDISLIGEHIVSVEKSEVFSKTDYKNRKKLGLIDMKELSHFMDSAKNNMPTFMDAWIYFGSFYFSSNLTNLFKDISSNLLSYRKWSGTDMKRWVSGPQFRSKEHNRSFYTPLFDAYINSKDYSTQATNAFETYFYQYYGINESKTIPKKIAASLSKIADENPNTLEREFKKLIYKSPVSVSNLNSDSFGLYTGSNKTREEGIMSLHAQFNLYIPSSVKSVNKGQSYQEDRELFVLHIDGEDHHIPNALSGALNKILAARKTGVRVVPIPIALSKDYYGHNRYVNTLAIMNFNQFRYLTDKYIPAKFPELRNANAFQSIDFSKTDGEAQYEIEADEAIDTTGSIFSAGFANDIKWTWFKEKYTDKLKSKQQWNKAMDVLTTFTGSKKPSAKWVSEMNKIIDEIGETQYFDELGSLIYESREEKSWFFDEYNKTLKGMIWSCTLRSTERSLLIIKTVTELSYTKVPGVGPRSTKTGNFSMEALANSPSAMAYGILQLMRLKSKYPRFVNALNKFIEKYKEINKGNIEELEDKALPQLGFENGIKIYNFIDAELEVSFNKAKIVKTYIINGKRQKKIPDIINQKHSVRLKEVTAEIKQINEIIKSLHARLKTFWLYNRSWKFTDWYKYIFHHPLMKAIVENMVWIGLESEELFISKTDKLIQTSGASILLDENEKVALWHPSMAGSKEIEELKKYYKQNKLTQHEKQVEREFYTFTEKELAANQSDRFAYQKVKVNKLMALANSTGWIFTYVHEDVSWPRIYLKELDITAHFNCDYDRNAEFIPTKELFFSRGNSSKISYNTVFEKIKFRDIPETTLSEICRDIDMFISVANEKND